MGRLPQDMGQEADQREGQQDVHSIVKAESGVITDELGDNEQNRVNQENGKSWKPQTVSTFLARLVTSTRFRYAVSPLSFFRSPSVL